MIKILRKYLHFHVSMLKVLPDVSLFYAGLSFLFREVAQRTPIPYFSYKKENFY